MADSLYHRGLGYQHKAVKIMQYEGQVIKVPYVEHYPPDTTAALRWLQNRQPGRWRDKREIDYAGSIAHQISLMSPEERAQDALELAERVRRRLAEFARAIEHEPTEE
jgi:hypothetical protein